LPELYALHAPAALRLAYLLTGSRDLAEVLFRDAFGRVIARWHGLRDPQAFGPYLRRAVVNLSNSRFRRRLERAYLARK
jgi:DNA-directed RNA polymerase specialized sigma24 family protein